MKNSIFTLDLSATLKGLTDKQLLIMLSENCTSLSRSRFCTDIYYDGGNKEVTIPYEFVFMGRSVRWNYDTHIGQRHHGSHTHVIFNGKGYTSKRHSEVIRLLKKALLSFLKANFIENGEREVVYEMATRYKAA